MTDRKLLELAAKAAGYRVIETRGHALLLADPPVLWNPLTDDGDALRLAVKLEIDVDFYLADVQARRDGFNPVFELFSEHNDRTAATRRAITRAAAEIGKGMK
jgi:hypothetical protein